MQQYDVIVIGAGPSGAIASKTCAGNGLKTLLFEKEGIPRLKLCGGAVSTSALSDLDFGIKKDLIERECYGARVHFKNHQIEVKRKSRLAILVSRDKFDAYLVSKAVDAGVALHEAEKATSIKPEQSEIVVETNKEKYHAKVVIGADGVNSIVSKYVRDSYKPDELGFCIAAEIPASNEEVNEYIENAIDIYYGIGNLITFVEETHKFELRYIDNLVGAKLPAGEKEYRERSPINHLDRLNVPMIIFQGTEDKIVTPECSRELARNLEERGIRYEYVEYEGESHGFRIKKNNVDSLSREFAFYRVVFST